MSRGARRSRLRVLVATPPLLPGEAVLSAGVLTFEGPFENRVGEGLALIVKAAFSFAAGEGGRIDPRVRPIATPEPLCLSTPSALAGAFEGELARPSDFVPRKRGADVLLTGHAYAERAVTRIDASIAVGSMRRSFAAVRTAPLERIPLVAEHVRDLDGIGRVDPVGPVPVTRGPLRHRVDFDFAGYCSAVPSQRLSAIGPRGEVIELEGLSPHARRRAVEVPDPAPRAVAILGSGSRIPFDLACDTLAIDTDREALVLVWRGAIPLPEGGVPAIDRVVLWQGSRDLASVERELARGAVAWAIEERDLRGAQPAVDADELRAARFAMMEDDAPDPTLSLEDYAAISAELQEKREPRDVVLRCYGLDEHIWMLEERGWLEAMARRAIEGDGSLAARYGDLFLAAQDGLAAPSEDARGLDVYAPIKAAMQSGADPSKVLSRHGLTLPEWMRLDRRFTAAARADAGLAADLDRRVAEAEAALGDAFEEPPADAPEEEEDA